MTKMNHEYRLSLNKGNWDHGSITVKGSAVGTMEVDAWALDATSKKSKRSGAHFGDRTACSRGHEYVTGSFSWKIDNKRGTPIRICLICKAARARAERANMTPEARDRMREVNARWNRDKRAAKKLGITVKEYRLRIGDVDIAKKNPLDYLRSTTEQGQAQDAVDYAVDQRGRPKCEKNPDAYFGDDIPPSNEQAAKMCEGCPIMVECLARMKLSIPIEGAGWMVAGARVFNDGKLVPLR